MLRLVQRVEALEAQLAEAKAALEKAAADAQARLCRLLGNRETDSTAHAAALKQAQHTATVEHRTRVEYELAKSKAKVAEAVGLQLQIMVPHPPPLCCVSGKLQGQVC